MDTLCKNVIILISEYLSMRDICRFMRMGKRINRILRADQIWARFTRDMDLLDFPDKGFYDYLIKKSKREIYCNYIYIEGRKAVSSDPTLVSRKYFGTIIIRPHTYYNILKQFITVTNYMFLYYHFNDAKNIAYSKGHIKYVDECYQINKFCKEFMVFSLTFTAIITCYDFIHEKR